MIALRPYDDLSAMAIFQALDPCDQYEVDLVRGAVTTPLALFAEWRAMQGQFLVSCIALTKGGSPFAVFGLMPAGQAGGAVVALLARDHRHFRRPLAELGAMIRARLHQVAAEQGLARLEARSWSDHPTANRLLRAIGFCEECRMSGFGPAGRHGFTQYALIPACTPTATRKE